MTTMALLSLSDVILTGPLNSESVLAEELLEKRELFFDLELPVRRSHLLATGF